MLLIAFNDLGARLVVQARIVLDFLGFLALGETPVVVDETVCNRHLMGGHCGILQPCNHSAGLCWKMLSTAAAGWCVVGSWISVSGGIRYTSQGKGVGKGSLAQAAVSLCAAAFSKHGEPGDLAFELHGHQSFKACW